MSHRLLFFSFSFLFLFCAGCPESHPVDPPPDSSIVRPDTGPRPDSGGCVPGREACNAADDDCDGRTDEGPLCPAGSACSGGRCCTAAGDDVDLLFVIDNSSTMAEEQARFADQIDRLIPILMTGDLNLDGSPDVTPLASLQVGVITTDMGNGGFPISSCSREPNFGDDGVLRTRGNVGMSGCRATYPPFLTLTTPADAEMAALDARCLAAAGTDGCGFEQQLEAMLKALTPSSSPLDFSMGTVGHGDGVNAGFLRPGSLLVVILLTDEDDCSAFDLDLFNPMSMRYRGELNLRCFQHPEALHGISRFVDGLTALRPFGRVAFAAITGIPPALGAEPIDYDAILDHPEMVERPDPGGSRLEAVCRTADGGGATPARRIVQVAQALDRAGASATVQSICQEDYTRTMEAILLETILPVLMPTCR